MLYLPITVYKERRTVTAVWIITNIIAQISRITSKKALQHTLSNPVYRDLFSHLTVIIGHFHPVPGQQVGLGVHVLQGHEGRRQAPLAPQPATSTVYREDRADVQILLLLLHSGIGLDPRRDSTLGRPEGQQQEGPARSEHCAALHRLTGGPLTSLTREVIACGPNHLPCLSCWTGIRSRPDSSRVAGEAGNLAKWIAMLALFVN
ncbi:hypothetical protein AVEN_107702-1 [Araneus ventricosus]|uniref:Uncharacterized protein n=1 Tax=Araneus ventricosus TaxID=182803 RepID=A0A4Y2B1E1_ARAVE|nr:hypothetical protein AVEN_107702-1 [Araneus ventricosus]